MKVVGPNFAPMELIHWETIFNINFKIDSINKKYSTMVPFS